jgi:hypothetical protein
MSDKIDIIQIAKDAIINSRVKPYNIPITCKIVLAKGYREIGYWNTKTNEGLPNIDIDFFESKKNQNIYEELLNSPNRFNKVEIRLKK